MAGPRASRPVPVTEWVIACALAETVGMTAAAGAARIAQGSQSVALALSVVVAGGLVEGLALGFGQSGVLRHRWPGLAWGRFVAVTVLVAGLGWAAGSAPGVLSDAGSDAAPPLVLVLLGATGIGLVMGPVLGAAQAWVLRPVVRHPGQWVLANTVAWPAAMVVIFLGASRPGADWPLVGVLLDGAITGAAAGIVLGLVTGRWLDRLGSAAAPTTTSSGAERLR